MLMGGDRFAPARDDIEFGKDSRSGTSCHTRLAALPTPYSKDENGGGFGRKTGDCFASLAMTIK